jgi:hypothetical protein
LIQAPDLATDLDHFFESARDDEREMRENVTYSLACYSYRLLLAASCCRLNAENQSLIALYAPNDMPAVGATLNSIGIHPLNNPLNPSFFKVVFTTCIAPSYLRSRGVKTNGNPTPRKRRPKIRKELTFLFQANR